MTAVVGREVLGGRHADLYGTRNFGYAAFVTLEEFFEMVGIIAFVFALLSYLRSEVHPSPSVTVSFGRRMTK